jgi:hypothetical protein
MLTLSACSACGRHVKSHEPSCPFCGAVIEAGSNAPLRARRMSRAEWLARGSLIALASCTSTASGGAQPTEDATAMDGSTGEPEASQESGGEAGGDAALDAAVDVTVDVAVDTGSAIVDAASPADAGTDGPHGFGACFEGGVVPASLGSGPLQCGPPTYDDAGHPLYDDAGYPLIQADAGFACDRATQYCDYRSNRYSCLPLEALCQGYFISGTFVAGCDSGAFRCACINVTTTCPTGTGWCCSDDDAGGLYFSYPCYGAPPARLERVARRQPAIA